MFDVFPIFTSFQSNVLVPSITQRLLISTFKYYYEFTNFDTFHDSIHYCSFLPFFYYSFLPPFSFFFLKISQFWPVETTSTWLFGHCDTTLATFNSFLRFWCYKMFQTQPVYFLLQMWYQSLLQRVTKVWIN